MAEKTAKPKAKAKTKTKTKAQAKGKANRGNPRGNPHKKSRLTIEGVRHALIATGNNRTAAAQLLKCARSTLNAFIKKHDKTFEPIIHDVVESSLDMVEAVLMKHIRDGNVASAIFYLKTKGKHRGWSERQEITGADGGPVLTLPLLPKAPTVDAWVSLIADYQQDHPAA